MSAASPYVSDGEQVLTGRLAGKIAVITGGASGLGESMALLFHREGAKVVIADVNDDNGQAAAQSIGAEAHFVHHDVCHEESWHQLLNEVSARVGPPDVLVNNAGISSRTALLDIDADALRHVVDVNLIGPILGMKVFGTAMKERRRGSMINVSSIAGVVGVSPILAYSSSKWGLRGATRSAAIELGPFGVRVNSLHPGGILTPLTGQPSCPDLEPPLCGQTDPDPARAERDAERTYQPIRRVSRPIEVARLALFLASDEASYCTGAEFVVDGGRTSGFELTT